VNGQFSPLQSVSRYLIKEKAGNRRPKDWRLNRTRNSGPARSPSGGLGGWGIRRTTRTGPWGNGRLFRRL